MSTRVVMPRRCCFGGGGEGFPVGAAGVVAVDVGVDEAGEDGVGVSSDGDIGWGGGCNVYDFSIRDDEVAGAGAAGGVEGGRVEGEGGHGETRMTT